MRLNKIPRAIKITEKKRFFETPKVTKKVPKLKGLQLGEELC
jgi:hypothetical protein